MNDLNEHPMAVAAAIEANVPSTSDRSWERYADQAGRALKKRMACCDETEDGCSLDSAHDAWRAGVSVAAYVSGDRSASPWASPR